jgi:hypothetical protein
LRTAITCLGTCSDPELEKLSEGQGSTSDTE